MPFYHFGQNNSGDVFDLTDTLTRHVIIEADSPEEANAKILSLGAYFNGRDAGIDCECCGDRWYPVGDWNASDVPQIYGRPPIEECVEPAKLWMPKGKNAVIYYRDGRVEWL